MGTIEFDSANDKLIFDLLGFTEKTFIPYPAKAYNSSALISGFIIFTSDTLNVSLLPGIGK